MDDSHYTFEEKLKMYENLLRSYQEELEKKTKESLKLRVDLDLLNTKYTTMMKREENEKISPIVQKLREELEQKNQIIDSLKSSMNSLKETLRKAEKKISIMKLEIEKKEEFIKEILYEKKQVEMDLEEKLLLLGKNEGFGLKVDLKPSKVNKELETNLRSMSEELDLSKNINKTLITLLKWKNIEVEQLKNTQNHSNSTSEEEFEEKLEKFKAQEKVLLERLAKQMQEFKKISNNSIDE